MVVNKVLFDCIIFENRLVLRLNELSHSVTDRNESYRVHCFVADPIVDGIFTHHDCDCCFIGVTVVIFIKSMLLSSPLLSGLCPPILLCPVILCSFSTNRTSSFEHATSVRLLSSIARKSVTVIPF